MEILSICYNQSYFNNYITNSLKKSIELKILGGYMWIENRQKYNELVWKSERTGELKDILLNDMNISIRLLVALKKGENIFVNGKLMIVKENIRANDLIMVKLPEESSEYLAEKRELNIMYEDNDVIVVEKPFGEVVHPTKSHLTGTMLNAILYYFRENNIKSKVRFVNRLDKDTSGVLIVAKNAYAHSVMTKENTMWNITKEYLAVVEGNLSGDGSIRLRIAKSDDNIRREINENGQEAITHYRSIASNDKATVVKVRLETGRTHQIRVHMKAIGHTLFGDELYGGNMELIQRQALHSQKIGFFSPRGEKMVKIENQLPEDIEKLIKILGLNIF